MFVGGNESSLAFQTGSSYLSFIAYFFVCIGLKALTDGVLRGSGDVVVFTLANLCNLAVRVSIAFICCAASGAFRQCGYCGSAWMDDKLHHILCEISDWKMGEKEVDLTLDKNRKGKVVMRQEKFKMERQGLVEEGQRVKVTERVNGSLYSYVVEPAVAMSGIYRSNARIQSREGIIREIQQNDRGSYLLVEFEE